MKMDKKGCFCKSISGHDKDTIYIIVEDQDGIRVCDGRTRTLGNPKKKNPKHLEIFQYRDELLNKKLAEQTLHDVDIKYSIKMYLIHIKKMQEVSECQSQM